MKSIAFSLPLALFAVASGSVSAQSWDERIQARWPGQSIRKVSEAEFLAFAKHQAPGLDRKAGARAFLDAQYRAYGLPTNEGIDFAIPSNRSWTVRPEAGLDAIVPEGAEPNGDPNDPVTPGTPTPITFGAEGHGYIAAGDEDWWSITPPVAFDARIWIGPGNVAPPDDVQLTVYDSAGTLVAYNDDFHRFYSQVVTRLQAGTTYYIAVAGFDPSLDFGDYTLDVTGQPVLGALNTSFGRTLVSETAEPNNHPLQGGTPMSIQCGEIGEGNISSGGEEDAWAVTLAAPALLTARVGPPLSGGNELYDSVVTVYDSNGVAVAFDDDSNGRRYSRVAANLTAGTYYVAVSGYVGTSSYTGDYTVAIDCGPPLAAIAEGPEQNGSPFATVPGTPTNISCGSFITGNIGVTGDQDWYRITLARGGLIYATTMDDPGAAANQQLTDSVIYLRDDAGNELWFNDDYESAYSRIELVVPAGTYYIDVRGFQNSRGAYGMEVECRSGFAGVLFDQGGCPGTNGTPLIYPRFSTYGSETFEAPALGSTFSLDIAGMPANGAGVMVVGLSDTLYLGVPLPIDLGVVGAPGCFAAVSIDAQLPLLADAQGDAVFAIDVPYLTTLEGAEFYCQAAVLDVGANALNITTSNKVSCVIGAEVHFLQQSYF